MCYPTDEAGRQQLADELTLKGFQPTQPKHKFLRGKIVAMADAMKDGTFNWKAASQRPVVLGPNNEVIGGHHRVVAAHLAGIDLATVQQGPGPQIYNLPTASSRPVEQWIDVLPDVA